MWRYPRSMAAVTAAATSPGFDFQVPRPKAGIASPLFKVTVGTAIAEEEDDEDDDEEEKDDDRGGSEPF